MLVKEKLAFQQFNDSTIQSSLHLHPLPHRNPTFLSF